MAFEHPLPFTLNPRRAVLYYIVLSSLPGPYPHLMGPFFAKKPTLRLFIAFTEAFLELLAAGQSCSES